MLLQISTTLSPATDLGFLLAKNPARVQPFPLSFGVAHAFYPVADEESCTFALLLEVDPVALVRGKGKESGPLSQYVNDRPYIASSFLSVALAQVLRSALNGVCKEKPELAASEIPLQLQIEGAPCSEELAKTLFEPLGYEVEVEKFVLDARFPAWGDAPFVRLKLKTVKKLSEALSHLYVLLPVMDDDKHYYIGEGEVEKLLKRGEGWLENHPQKPLIVSRYLKRQKRLVFAALEKLSPETDSEAENDAQEAQIEEKIDEKAVPLHQIRIETVLQVLKDSGARRVLDLGCGEGKLLRELLKDKQFEEILGLDASHRALEIASDKLKLERLPEMKREKIKLLHGALTYRDDRLKGYDAAALIEVIEHLDAPRLHSFERAVFEFARPDTIVLTTPNSEYNVKWDSLPAGKLRHRDHRFEWSRQEFTNWAQKVALDYGYEVETSALGPLDEEVGAPSQMGVFRRKMATKRHPDKNKTEPFEALLEQARLLNEEEDAYWDIVWLLGNRGDRETFEKAFALTNGDQFERNFGALILGRFGAPLHPFSSEIIDRLLEMLGREQNEDVIASLISSLGQQEKDSRTPAAICRFINHSDAEIRWVLAIALAGYETPQALETLIVLTCDREIKVRNWATFGIGQQSEMDTPEIRAALFARLSDEDAETRSEAIIGLAQRRDPRVVEAIRREFAAGVSNTLVFEALVEMPDETLLPALLKESQGEKWKIYHQQDIRDAIIACEIH